MRRGKVRDIYDLGDRLLLVATDRISAFDWILPTGIPDKGRVLTQLSAFWFGRLGEPHHLLSTDVASMPACPPSRSAPLAGRSMLVRKTEVVPIECVVRGYLAGSGWKEYQKTQSVCGIRLPAGLQESDRLPEPIFTPATKAESGHDINISFDQMVEVVGREVAEELRRRSMEVYRRGAEYARSRGHHHRRHQVRMGPARRRADSDRRSADAGQLAVLAGRTLSARRCRRHRSTSSSCATGWKRPPGTRTARRPNCPTRSSPARATSTSKPTSG